MQRFTLYCFNFYDTSLFQTIQQVRALGVKALVTKRKTTLTKRPIKRQIRVKKLVIKGRTPAQTRQIKHLATLVSRPLYHRLQLVILVKPVTLVNRIPPAVNQMKQIKLARHRNPNNHHLITVNHRQMEITIRIVLHQMVVAVAMVMVLNFQFVAVKVVAVAMVGMETILHLNHLNRLNHHNHLNHKIRNLAVVLVQIRNRLSIQLKKLSKKNRLVNLPVLRPVMLAPNHHLQQDQLLRKVDQLLARHLQPKRNLQKQDLIHPLAVAEVVRKIPKKLLISCKKHSKKNKKKIKPMLILAHLHQPAAHHRVKPRLFHKLHHLNIFYCSVYLLCYF